MWINFETKYDAHSYKRNRNKKKTKQKSTVTRRKWRAEKVGLAKQQFEKVGEQKFMKKFSVVVA